MSPYFCIVSPISLDRRRPSDYLIDNAIGHMTSNTVLGEAGMLEPLLESTAKEKILLYLYTHGESYPREIARSLGAYVTAIQYQLAKLEDGGVLYSKLRGRIRLFGFNPRYPFKKELEALLAKALSFVPEAERDRLYRPRLRPRRTGKPLP
jgi:DNA-binding transcriptional ArsR family regulator